MVPPIATGSEGYVNGGKGFEVEYLTPNGVSARRAKSKKLPTGIAAATSSEDFKGPSAGKPLAKNFDHLISTESKARGASSLKGAIKHLTPEIISLGGGLPCSEYFPFQEISMKVPLPPNFTEEDTRKNGTVITAGKYDIPEGKSAYDLAIALNYGQGTGSAQLLRYVTEHTEIVCHPPYADWQCAITVGSTNALEQAYRIFTERGDYMLADEYTFSSAVETALPLGVKMIGVKMDSEGLLAEDMDEILSNWDAKARGARKPHLLYTIPTGQNPSGATQGEARRRAIYKVAQKHDVYILEDEPYYFLQMQPYTGADAPAPPPPANNEEFLKALAPTYVSLDVDGRVMRLDSFSKVIAPGTRTGWVTASAQIIERFVRHSEVSAQNPSGISQILLFKLLDETWGHDGYLAWLINLRLEYTKRRNTILAACETYLPRDIVKWNPPAAGMFLWFEIDWTKHPEATTKILGDLEEEIFLDCINGGVLISKGSWFAADKEFVPNQMFFRATFAAASGEKMTEAIERLGVAIRKAFNISN